MPAPSHEPRKTSGLRTTLRRFVVRPAHRLKEEMLVRSRPGKRSSRQARRRHRLSARMSTVIVLRWNTQTWPWQLRRQFRFCSMQNWTRRWGSMHRQQTLSTGVVQLLHQLQQRQPSCRSM